MRFLLCRDDRFFPAEFMRRAVRDRLDITPDEMDGGHLVALSRPKELAERLMTFGSEQIPPGSACAARQRACVRACSS